MIEKVLVVGLGVSGQSVCKLLLKQGYQVIGTDIKPRARFGNELNSLEEKGCVLQFGEHRLEDFLKVDQIIVSPGVPLNSEPLRQAAIKGIEIIGELEWAWRQVNLPVVAVTGTNGKTTTTSLLGEILKASGKRVFVGGNIGTPLSQWLLSKEEAELLVLEVSSFQLDTASRFFPQVGILLNVTEDHLDRYDDFHPLCDPHLDGGFSKGKELSYKSSGLSSLDKTELSQQNKSFLAYANSKLSLFARQDTTHVAIINGDDPVCRAGLHEIPGRTLIFSRKNRQAHGTVRDHEVRIQVPGNRAFHLSLEHCVLQGPHNEENILATVLAATVLGVDPNHMQDTLDRYHGLPHRMEWVRNWKGVDFYDDSKATNVGAVVKALENFNRPVLLLLGGRDKLGSYEPLMKSIQRKGKGIFAFGEAGPRLHQEIKKWFDCIWAFPDLETAFQEAVRQVEPGDVVLLSPACSSFDQYANYAQRGDHFKRLVNEL
jgi:UDP-N-acetylmuramoylalanine--D-glutamate ligase